MSIIQAVGFFFGHGSGNYISRKLGAQETESAEKMASTGFFFALFIGAALAVLGLLFLTPLSLALGSTLLFFRIRSAIWESFCWVLLL